MNRSFLYHFMKSKYPLLEEKRLKNVINELPKEYNMADRYVTASEFRKLSLVTELLTERFQRKDIQWFCEEDGWSLLITDGGGSIVINLSEEYITESSVMMIFKTIIGGL